MSICVHLVHFHSILTKIWNWLLFWKIIICPTSTTRPYLETISRFSTQDDHIRKIFRPKILECMWHSRNLIKILKKKISLKFWWHYFCVCVYKQTHFEALYEFWWLEWPDLWFSPPDFYWVALEFLNNSIIALYSHLTRLTRQMLVSQNQVQSFKNVLDDSRESSHEVNWQEIE